MSFGQPSFEKNPIGHYGPDGTTFHTNHDAHRVAKLPDGLNSMPDKKQESASYHEGLITEESNLADLNDNVETIQLSREEKAALNKTRHDDNLYAQYGKHPAKKPHYKDVRGTGESPRHYEAN